MKVSEISEILNNWMPTSIQEDYDNVGLIVGNPDSLVANILITLDTTNEVIDEAVKKNCNLVISYHPIIFNGLKKITSNSGYVQKSIINAVKNNISIYAIHTSLDNHPEGITYFLAKKIGLKNLSILVPKTNELKGGMKTGIGIIGKLGEPKDENSFFDLLKKSNFSKLKDLSW